MQPFLCTVLPEYTDKLYQEDHRVLLEHPNGKARKFLCIALEIDEKLYCVPFSSPDRKDYISVSGETRVRRSAFPVILRLFGNYEGERRFYGKLLFSNMIPVCHKAIQEYRYEEEEDLHYKNLVRIQYDIVLHEFRTGNVSRYSQKIYSDKMDDVHRPYVANTVDFSRLEHVCKQWSYDQIHVRSEYHGHVIYLHDGSLSSFSEFIDMSEYDRLMGIEGFDRHATNEVQDVILFVEDEFHQVKQIPLEVILK